jgi:hypothetical protein
MSNSVPSVANYRPKTHEQIQRLFGLAKDRAALAGTDTKTFLEDLAALITRGRVRRLSQLSHAEANEMITRLGGEPLPAPGSPHHLGSPPYEGGVAPASGDGVVLSRNPKRETVSVRTQQLRRQKAGVKQIVSPAQVKKIDDLWFRFSHRTAQGLDALVRRTIKRPSPTTTEEANKIIEAIKSMNRREENYGDGRRAA